MIQKYKKKPVVISALQFTCPNDKKKKEIAFKECVAFIGIDNIAGVKPLRVRSFIDIKTLEGNIKCVEGDYIIKGVKGEFYPCKPDIFKLTYDSVKETKQKNK